MKNRTVKQVLIAVALVLMLMPLAVFAGGKKEEPAVTAPETVTITDAMGRQVTIKKPVERIALSFNIIEEMIKLLGAWDRVVAVGPETITNRLFRGASELPVISSPMNAYDLNFEKVFEVHPDIFLTIWRPGAEFEDTVARLEPEIPVVVVGNTNDPEIWTDGVTLLGSILGKEEEAAEFVAWYKGVENDIKGKTAGLLEGEKPRVFYKVPGFTPESFCTVTSEFGLVEPLFEISGGINIAADLPAASGWVQNVDPEWLLEQNPEVVITHIWEMYNPGVFGFEVDDPSVAEATREQIMNMVEFAHSDAVANGEVYLFEDEFPFTPRILVAMAYWAKWFHPELFEDLDPQAIHQEYLTRFIGIDYDLSQHGVFVYPVP